MSYATVADIQARFPDQILTIGGDSQPSREQVNDLIEQQSLWLDSALGWKYVAPVTDATDLKLLKPIVVALVAAQLWQVIEGYGDEGSRSQAVRKEALSMLAYDQKSGRSMLVLPNTLLADSGEAAIGQPLSTFTDPDAVDTVTGLPARPRLFTIGMDF